MMDYSFYLDLRTMVETQFDKDIALTPLSEGRYQVNISESWKVILGPNGGYIAAIILNGMKAELGNVQTRSITFHFLSASVPGLAELHVNVDKKGRTLSTCTAKLFQGKKTIAIAIATFASAQENFAFCDLDMTEVPDPEDIAISNRMNPDMPWHVPFRDQYDQRLAIGPIPPATSEEGRVGGWTRFREHRQFDDLAIVAISDSWFPGLSVKELPEPMHAPTVDHSVHFLTSMPMASIGIEDFLLVEFTTGVSQEGYLIENGNIWAPDGTLIAQSRQLAILLPR